MSRLPQLKNSARHLSCWGVTAFSRRGYQAPKPPPGPPHRYRFTLTALDRTIDLPAGATAAEVRDAYASSMAVLCLYVNRAGSQLSQDRRVVLERSKVELRRLYGREQGRP